MKTLNTLNTKLLSNEAKINTLKTSSNDTVTEAMQLVNEKIASIVDNSEYKATERKAIKVIQTEMFTPKNKDDKLTPKLRTAIKVIVVAHKRDVYSSILWDEMSINKINEVLIHLTVKEIKDCTSVEDFKEALEAKKTRAVTTTAYPKKEAK